MKENLEIREVFTLKKKALLFLAVAMMLLLAACSGGTSSPPADGGGAGDGGQTARSESPSDSSGNGSESAPEEVTLRIAWWGGQSRHDVTLEVIELYQEQNPHVIIEPEFTGWDEYWQRLAPQAAANDLPDIIQMDLSYITQYATRGQLADLSPYVDSGLFRTEHISDSALSGGLLDGKLYGMNLGVNAIGMTYNPEILQAAGLSEPNRDWTYDEWEQLAYDVTEKGYYFTEGINNEEFFAYYLRTQGQRMYAADGKSLGYDDDRYFIEYFGRIQRMYDAGAIAPMDMSQQIQSWEDGLTARGESLADFVWSNQFVGLTTATQKPLVLHPLPGPGVKEGLFLKPSMYFSVFENSKVKEEAVKFIDFFVNDIEANKILRGDRGVPIASDVQEALRPELDDVTVATFDFIAWVDENSSPIDPPPPVGASEVTSELNDLVERMLYKTITVEEAAERFRESANSILSSN